MSIQTVTMLGACLLDISLTNQLRTGKLRLVRSPTAIFYITQRIHYICALNQNPTVTLPTTGSV